MYRERAGLWDELAGKWRLFRGEVHKQWAKLTDDDLEYIAGQRDNLVGKVQERYGIEKQEAEQQIDRWSTDFKY